MERSLGAPLMGSNTIHSPKTKKWRCSAGTETGCQLSRMIPIDSIGSVFKLSFHPYQVRPNLTPYANWASILVWVVPRFRNGLEVDLVWTSNLTWAALHVSYGGGHGGGRSWASSNSSPHLWGVLQLGPGSQV